MTLTSASKLVRFPDRTNLIMSQMRIGSVNFSVYCMVLFRIYGNHMYTPWALKNIIYNIRLDRKVFLKCSRMKSGAVCCHIDCRMYVSRFLSFSKPFTFVVGVSASGSMVVTCE